jgi:hypothetical protein
MLSMVDWYLRNKKKVCEFDYGIISYNEATAMYYVSIWITKLYDDDFVTMLNNEGEATILFTDSCNEQHGLRVFMDYDMMDFRSFECDEHLLQHDDIEAVEGGFAVVVTEQEVQRSEKDYYRRSISKMNRKFKKLMKEYEDALIGLGRSEDVAGVMRNIKLTVNGPKNRGVMGPSYMISTAMVQHKLDKHVRKFTKKVDIWNQGRVKWENEVAGWGKRASARVNVQHEKLNMLESRLGDVEASMWGERRLDVSISNDMQNLVIEDDGDDDDNDDSNYPEEMGRNDFGEERCDVSVCDEDDAELRRERRCLRIDPDSGFYDDWITNDDLIWTGVSHDDEDDDTECVESPQNRKYARDTQAAAVRSTLDLLEEAAQYNEEDVDTEDADTEDDDHSGYKFSSSDSDVSRGSGLNRSISSGKRGGRGGRGGGGNR